MFFHFLFFIFVTLSVFLFFQVFFSNFIYWLILRAKIIHGFIDFSLRIWREVAAVTVDRKTEVGAEEMTVTFSQNFS